MSGEREPLSWLPWKRARQLRERTEQAVEALHARDAACDGLLAAIDQMNATMLRAVEHFGRTESDERCENRVCDCHGHEFDDADERRAHESAVSRGHADADPCEAAEIDRSGPSVAEPHPHDVIAMIPDKYGLAVVDVAQLLSYLADGDYTLEEAIAYAAIDTVTNVEDSTERIRALNATGDEPQGPDHG